MASPHAHHGVYRCPPRGPSPDTKGPVDLACLARGWGASPGAACKALNAFGRPGGVDMPKIPRFEPVRQWSERHAHHPLRIAEAEDGRLWLRVEDLRQWVPGLARDAVLLQRHPGMLRLVDASPSLYLEASTFAWLTRKSSNVPTLKLRAWLEAQVLAPARKRHQWADYPGTSFEPHDLQPVAAAAPPWQPVLDPRRWRITEGRWGLKTTMAVGLAGSLLGVVASHQLAARAWNVDNVYLFWAWVGIVVALWALLFNGGWMVGAMRSGLRRSGDGFNLWVTTGWVAVNLAAAFFMGAITLQNSALHVHVWWAAYVRGDPPVQITVDAVRPDGSALRLRLAGGVGLGSTRALRRMLAEHPGATEIELASPGGLAVEGFGMADALRRSSIATTQVRTLCASACTLLFVEGRERLVAQGAVLGFHRSYSLLGDYGSGWGPLEERMAQRLRRRGVAETFIQKAFSTPGWELYAPGLDVLVPAGVATGALGSR